MDYLFDTSKTSIMTRTNMQEFIDESQEEYSKISEYRQAMRIIQQVANIDFAPELLRKQEFLAQAIGKFEIVYPSGRVLQQPRTHNFFRGELREYPESTSSLHRKLYSYKSEKDKALYRLVSDMRIYEFSIILKEFEHVQSWDVCDVLYEALAQHYGLETCWLDITSDFMTAMFFANCWFDRKNREWRPLRKTDPEWCEYGVLYHAPSYVINERWAHSGLGYVVDLTDDGFEFHSGSVDKVISDFRDMGIPIEPIGYQPFRRCEMQNAYGLYSYGNYSLRKDRAFERLLFRHSDKLSAKIFEMAEGGKRIYPQEGISIIQDTIDDIASSTEFTIEAFRYALYRSHYYALADENECLKDLAEFQVNRTPIKIVDSSHWNVSAADKSKINRYYSYFSIGETGTFRTYSEEDKYYLRPWMIPENGSAQRGIVDFKPLKFSRIYSFINYSFRLLMTTFKDLKMADY